MPRDSSWSSSWLDQKLKNNEKRNSEGIPDLLKRMFPCPVSENFTSKVLYMMSDGLGPYFYKSLKDESREGAYTLMLDETNTHQHRKQMDVLIRFWPPKQDEVVTKYLTSILHYYIKDMLVNLLDDLPSNRFFNVSLDGPNININKALWRELDDRLKKSGHPGLLPRNMLLVQFIQKWAE